MPRSFLSACLALLCSAFGPLPAAFAQCIIPSSDGYQVNLAILPRTIVPSSYSCTYGYNYNVTIDYIVSFSGSHIPSSLYTLQGNLACGSDNHFYDLPNGGGTGSITTGSNVWRGISDCVSATTTSLGCSALQIEINGPGIANQTLTCAMAPLPVELLTFVATVDQDQAMLSWETSREENNAYFAVERSDDGTTFTESAQLPGGGTTFTRREYAWLDPRPVFSRTWYRLRQVDTDGKVHYSVMTEANNPARITQITLAPNPGNGQYIHLNGRDLSSYALRVLDLHGKSLAEQPSCSATVYLPDLQPGVYLLSFTHHETGETQTLRYCVA